MSRVTEHKLELDSVEESGTPGGYIANRLLSCTIARAIGDYDCSVPITLRCADVLGTARPAAPCPSEHVAESLVSTTPSFICVFREIG
jgi:hypothetical protein